MAKNKHGGRRANQTGRPRSPNKKVRIGVLFLDPHDVAQLAQQVRDGETLIKAARRLLILSLPK